MTAEALIGRRPLPGSSLEVSAIGISVDPTTPAGGAADDALIAQVRAARARGVTLFDIVPARFPARAERLIEAAFPGSHPELAVIVPDSVEPAPPVGGPVRSPRIESRSESPTASPWVRLAGKFSLIVEASGGGADRDAVGARLTQLESLTSKGTISTWSLRIEGEDPLPPGSIGDAAVVRLSIEASLLAPDRAQAIAARADETPTSVFVRGPFASGRLDGTRFAAELSARGIPARPVDVGTLRAEFAPVLRLGFLTTGHRRTLAQAALQYFLPRPWLASVLIPLPRPERLSEILSAGTAPPLTEEELARIDAGALEIPSDRRAGR